MRKVRVASTQFDVPKSVESDATTWGDLQTALMDAGININNMTATLSPSNVALQRGDAQLPEGDLIIFMNPTKVSAGNDEEVVGDIGSTEITCISVLSYNLLRSHASSCGIPLKGKLTKDDIASRILCYNLGANNDGQVLSAAAEKVVNGEDSTECRDEAHHSLMEAVKQIKAIAEKACGAEIDLTDKEKMEDLSEEDRDLMDNFRNFQNS